MIEIQNKLSEITNVIKKSNCTTPGLLNGNSGIAVFLGYANEIYKDADLNSKMENLLHQSFEQLEEEGATHTFSDGYSGLCWGMNHLVLKNKVDADINSLFNELEQYLIETSEKDFGLKYYDFIQGGIGAGIYFLNRLPDNRAKTHITNTVLFLYEQAVILDNDIMWPSVLPKEEGVNKKTEYNLGISHGMPSIIWFLSKCFHEKIEEEKCRFLINGAVLWILKQKLPTSSISLFPSAVDGSEDYYHSRLGWCYGDLGIASVIWQAGKALGKEEWKEEAIEIMLHASQRKDFMDNGIMDAGLCHGTAGIAHIFNRFYFETKMPIFKETANFWINEVLKMSSHEDGFAGFKNFREENGWTTQYGLLEGISGIGLALLSHISDEEPTWDRFLLLS